MGILMVAAGGAAGAVGRYGLSKIPFTATFPIATFITNIIGAFVIGFIAGVAERKGLNANLVLFIKTGICGGFTTFSTFSLESISLLSSGHILVGGIYIIASVVCCLVGVVLGQLASKLV